MFGQSKQALQDEARVERKKRVEEERKQRIFDPNLKSKIVDPSVLSEQSRQKQEQKEKEREADLAYINQRDGATKHLETVLEQREREKREALLNLQNYNLEQTRRSPNSVPKTGELGSIKIGLDSSLYYNSENYGTSSAQAFQGEDPSLKDRTRKQIDQNRDWFNQQVYEKNEKQRREREQQRLYESKVQEMDQKLEEYEEASNRARQEALARDRDYNKYLADLKREKEIHEKEKDTFSNMQEINLATTHGILTESPTSPTRGLRTEFKGMSPDQIRMIRDRQERQRIEKEQLLQKERELQQKWETLDQAQQKMITQKMTDFEAQKRENLRQIQEENRRLSQENKERNKNRNREYTTNLPSEDYFGQFNTSSR